MYKNFLSRFYLMTKFLPSIVIVTVFLLPFIIGIITKYEIRVPDIEVLKKIQKIYYFKEYRNIWQYEEECRLLDKDLIYKPKIGKCDFNNLEFETYLSFNKNGRINKNYFNKKLPSIAVLGDSYAMGWGVNDENTFSAMLQKLTQRKVYNLGVSSYATEQEIKTLLKHPDIDKINTIVIQYCDNDLSTNLEFPMNTTIANKRFLKFNEIYHERKKTALSKNYVLAVRGMISYFLPEKIKSFIKTNILDIQISNPVNVDQKQHKKNILIILNYYQDQLKDKKIIIFFNSGFNLQKTPDFWTESYKINSTEVDFIDVDLDKDHYYLIDDHLNKSGHKKVAEVINQFIKN